MTTVWATQLPNGTIATGAGSPNPDADTANEIERLRAERGSAKADVLACRNALDEVMQELSLTYSEVNRLRAEVATLHLHLGRLLDLLDDTETAMDYADYDEARSAWEETCPANTRQDAA